MAYGFMKTSRSVPVSLLDNPFALIEGHPRVIVWDRKGGEARGTRGTRRNIDCYHTS
jgi:hypothetical protein